MKKKKLKFISNPEYLTAAHVVLISGPGFPDFEQQIKKSEEALKRFKKELKEVKQ